MMRTEKQRQSKHQVSRGHSAKRPDHLSGYGGRYFAPDDATLHRIRERDRRVEMGARDRAHRQNQGNQGRSRGQRVRQEGHCDIAAGQALTHDAGAHNRCQEKCSAEEFCRHTPTQIECHCFPIASTSFCKEKRSRVESGRLRKKLILRSSRKNASRNAFSTCSRVPCTAAGSGMPQCAVIGWPGHTGHTSFAALSQTVKTKSSLGASRLANSSQLLLRRPVAGR